MNPINYINRLDNEWKNLKKRIIAAWSKAPDGIEELNEAMVELDNQLNRLYGRLVDKYGDK